MRRTLTTFILLFVILVSAFYMSKINSPKKEPKLNLKNSINYDIDPLNEPKCILYDCIQNAVNFDISNQNVTLSGNNDIFSIVNLYYDTYKSISL